MRVRSNVLFLALAFAAWVFLAGSGPALAGDAEQFNSAWRAFHELVKDGQRNRYRSSWEDLEKRFMAVYKSNPSGPLAPKSLYYAGRVNEELGKRSFKREDFIAANDYYQRVAARFPSHSWADDSLLRKAEVDLRHLNDPIQAEQDLLELVRQYPDGDMQPQAQSLLREISGQTAESRTAGGESQSYATHSGPTELTAVRYRSSDDYTRVVLDLSQETSYRYQILDPMPQIGKPHRLYIDLENTLLGPSVSREVNIADGILRRVRTGQNTPVVSRVVLDLQQLQKFHIFALENPFRIVVDISAPEEGEPARQVAMASPAPGPKPLETPSEPYKLPDGSKDKVGDLVEQLGLKIETVMLDPGHGGKDPGAIGIGKVYEKDINLRFALILGQELRKAGLKVIYTREDDTFIPLDERTAMANVQKADLFISIHCNAHKQSGIRGLETYYLNLARTDDAVRVAARENAVSTKRISDLQFILTDLMLNSKMRESKDLAEDVHACAVKELSKNYSIKDHGVRTAPFYVLMGAKMPSILVELGYITNSVECKRLRDETYLQRKAKGLAEGIAKYKQQIERFASL